MKNNENKPPPRKGEHRHRIGRYINEKKFEKHTKIKNTTANKGRHLLRTWEAHEILEPHEKIEKS